MKSLYVILLLVCLAGCATRIRYVPVKQMEIVTRVEHDTTIRYVPVPYRDSVSVPDTSSYLSNPYADSWAVWSGGRLSHSLNVFPDTIDIPFQVVDVYHTATVEVPIEVERELSRWERLKMDIGGWAIGVLSVIAVYAIVWLVRKRKGGKT